MTGRAGAVELEVRTSIVQLWNLTNGDAGLAVRVEYRPAGERRWRHFNLVPDEGQEVDRLERHAHLAAQLVHSGRVVALVDVDDQELVDERPCRCERFSDDGTMPTIRRLLEGEACGTCGGIIGPAPGGMAA